MTQTEKQKIETIYNSVMNKVVDYHTLAQTTKGKDSKLYETIANQMMARANGIAETVNIWGYHFEINPIAEEPYYQILKEN